MGVFVLQALRLHFLKSSFKAAVETLTFYFSISSISYVRRAAQSIYQRHYTVEEYFALAEQSAIRREYFHGEIFSLDGPKGMAGGTKQHNRLIQNCTFGLRTGIGERGCEIYAENVRLALSVGEHYNYPDVVD